jgi:hypothetical protein
MDLEYANTIIRESTCGCSTVHTITAHHRSYPEIAVEARTAARAVEHLERLLLRALDYDADKWRREMLHDAIADVRRCAKTLAVTPHPSWPEVKRSSSNVFGSATSP